MLFFGVPLTTENLNMAQVISYKVEIRKLRQVLNTNSIYSHASKSECIPPLQDLQQFL